MQAANNKPAETRGQPDGSSPSNSTAKSSVAAANSHPKLVPRPQPSPVSSVTQPLAHGFSDATTPTAAAPVFDPESSIHPTLRSPGYVPTPNMMPSGAQPPPEHPGPVHMPPNSSAPLDAEDPNADGRKAKRELSQSKRAAQNRAAQRAFRQRKEGYIKKLEQQVREFHDAEQLYKGIQSENFALREYIVHLQSRLMEAQVEFPPPPPNVNLSLPPGHGIPDQPAPVPPQEDAPMTDPTPNTGSATGTSSLDEVAQAVQSLNRSEASSYKIEPTAAESQAAEDARTAEEMTRQMEAEQVPAATM
ncbi:hypothetical protein KVR01_003600 [Diaporthe batatas]|uniref:uncharacterized protein n=1 Tax=Diaporthe batatas TaxID=748121 RepID=UPI001D053317|nr:uncharacterized protein KVR01_003600 [Diaporthe batatas]KAG8167911.1 hypothetical protein KVR01_003600 [Diaporthe batatas]